MNAASVNAAGFILRRGWTKCVVQLGFYSEIHAVSTQHPAPTVFVEPECLIVVTKFIVL